MSPQAFTYGTGQALAANAFSKEGYLFAGWNTVPDSGGTSYAHEAPLSLTETITLYAQRVLSTYYVEFSPTGGGGGKFRQTFTYGTEQALSPNAFTRTGYTFTGEGHGHPKSSFVPTNIGMT